MENETAEHSTSERINVKQNGDKMTNSKGTNVITNNNNTINTNNYNKVETGLQQSKKSKSQISSTGNSKNSTAHAPVPPDGGWGWVIVFSSFMVGVIVDGICFTFGFFFKDFQDYFGSNKSVTSSINSVLNGTYLTIGPIVGALVNKYGCRKVAFVGSIITSASFFLCTFSPNVEIMIIVYGLCGGIGFGLMYLPAIVMVGYYFDKRRALATGIAVCGSGMGSFLLSPLCEFLVQEIGWKGAMWIVSGLALNGVIFASLFRPLEFSDESTDTSESLSAGENDCNELKIKVFDENGVKIPVFNPSVQEIKNTVQNPIYRCRSMEVCNKKDNLPDKTTELARLGHSLFLDAEPRSRKHALGRQPLKPLQRKDIFYSGSIQNLPEYKHAGNEENFVKSMLSLNGSDSGEYKRSDSCFNKIFTEMFDISLLKSPSFVIYGLSCFLCMIGFFVPFIYIPEIAREYGMTSSQTAWIISSIGIINTVGRIAVGYFSDKPWVDSILINTIALVIAGAVTMFVPYYKIYPVLIAYAVVFGFSIAAFVSLRSIIIVELLGIDKLTNSFGLVVLCQGLSTFIGAPIAGAISDATGDYKASFYLAGSVIAISGLMCIPLRRLSSWEKRRAQKKTDQLNIHDVEQMKPMITKQT